MAVSSEHASRSRRPYSRSYSPPSTTSAVYVRSSRKTTRRSVVFLTWDGALWSSLRRERNPAGSALDLWLGDCR
eukprot:scaffold4501_cov395-Prasinococcus_capsulatus_cf.AAC.18